MVRINIEEYRYVLLLQNWYKRLRANEKMLMDNRRRFQHAGLLKGTGKNQIFVTSGEQAFNHGVEDDHIPFQKRG